jgi:hypothetical protein
MEINKKHIVFFRPKGYTVIFSPLFLDKIFYAVFLFMGFSWERRLLRVKSFKCSIIRGLIARSYFLSL